MRGRARQVLEDMQRRSRRRTRYHSLLNLDRDKQDLYHDNEMVQWGTDLGSGLVRTADIGNVSVPDKYFHFLTDPAGYKGRRDTKLLRQVERRHRRELQRELSKKKIDQEEPKDTKMQRRVAVIVRDALNDLLYEGEICPEHPQHQLSIEQGLPNFIEVTLTRDLLIANCVWDCKEGLEVRCRNALNFIKSKLRKRLTERRIDIKYSPKLVFKHKSTGLQSVRAESAMDRISSIEMPQLNKFKPSVANNFKPPPLPKTREEKIKHYASVMFQFARMHGEYNPAPLFHELSRYPPPEEEK